MILIRTLSFTSLVPGSVTLGAPHLLLSARMRAGAHAIQEFGLIGLIPIAPGIIVYLWCALDFALAGKGTPAPFDAPRLFVSRGLYQLVRNPMYLAVELILVGEAIVFASLMRLAYAVLLGLMFHPLVVIYEEPTLKQKFGTTYEEYCRAVPRWIPNLASIKHAD